MDKADMRLQARADQNWEDAKAYKADFARLVLTGIPVDERDAKLIRKACALIVAELYLREHEA